MSDHIEDAIEEMHKGFTDRIKILDSGKPESVEEWHARVSAGMSCEPCQRAEHDRCLRPSKPIEGEDEGGLRFYTVCCCNEDDDDKQVTRESGLTPRLLPDEYQRPLPHLPKGAKHVRFYLASSLDNLPEIDQLAKRLVGLGHEHTYNWCEHGRVYRSDRSREENETNMRATATAELGGVEAADMVIVVLPGGRGTHVELGAALASWKFVVIMTDHATWNTLRPCAFYFHRLVQHIIHDDSEERFKRLCKLIDGMFGPGTTTT